VCGGGGRNRALSSVLAGEEIGDLVALCADLNTYRPFFYNSPPCGEEEAVKVS
jgi:hypothetical protein